MADSRKIAKQIGVSEKDTMLQSIRDLQDDVRRLSESVSQKMGFKSNKNDDFKSTIARILKDDKNSTVEEITSKLLQNYKKTRQSDREEAQAQILASFKIFEEKLKNPIRSLASGMFDYLSKEKTGSGTDQAKAIKESSDAMSKLMSSSSKTLSKLLSPEKINKKEEPNKDASILNPNHPLVKDKSISKDSIKSTEKELGNLLKTLNIHRDSTKDQQKIINNIVNVLEKENKEQVKENTKKKKTVDERAADIKQEHFDKMNQDKKEALATWKAKKEIFREKYALKNIVSSLASDILGSFAKESTGSGTDQTKAIQESSAIANKLMKNGFNYAKYKFQAWMPTKKEKEEKDNGDNNPNFGSSLGEQVGYDIKKNKEAERYTKNNKSKEDSKYDSIYRAISSDDRAEARDRDNLADIEDTVFSLDNFVRFRLSTKIVDDIKKLIKSSSFTAGSSTNSEGEDGKDKQGSPFSLGNMFNVGKSIVGKIARVLKNGGILLTSLTKKAFSAAKSIGRGIAQLARPALGVAGRTLGVLGQGSAAGGAAVLALGAASAYTLYKTGETAATIIGNKNTVREGTKGSSDAAVSRANQQYNTNSEEVQKGTGRYKKAGLSEKEANYSSLAERQNTKMIASTSAMGGIFNAAKNSTDYRSSEEEVGKLDEGATLANSLGNILRGIEENIADPEKLKNKTPQQIKNLAKQAKLAVKQIGDLKKNWEDAKNLGQSGLDSPWVKDKTMVSNGDKIINSLVDSGKGIESAFDEWADVMQEGAEKRQEKKKENEIENKKQQAADTTQDTTQDTKEGEENTSPKIKEVSPTPEKSSEVSPSYALKQHIKEIDNSKAQATDIKTDIKENMTSALSGHTDSINSKLETLTSAILSMANRKYPVPPQQYNYALDAGFSNINSLARGS